MSSRLVVNQIQDSAAKNLDTTYLTNGSLKAWSVTRSDGTESSGEQSFNISSTTDESTNGEMSHDLTNAMDRNINLLPVYGNAYSGNRTLTILGNNTTSSKIYIYLYNSSNSGSDTKNSVGVLGDLA
jgi:hypothetical protein